MRILCITDSDSYVKWGATMLDRMPEHWDRTLTVLQTPAMPSRAQLASALTGTPFTSDDVASVDLPALAALVESERPDAVLLSVRGPVVRVIIRMIAALPQPRPVFVGGLPGISIPETLNALYYRSQLDYLVLHSKREIRAFAALAARLGIQQDFGLARLPFLGTEPVSGRRGTDIVFAAQAKVPKPLEDRRLVLGWLAATARRHPDARVVIKLRGLAGEAQTHSEAHPYDVLLADLEDAPPNLVVSTGSMAQHLADAAGLVTVSSTAALEAIAAGVPVIALSDFGVDASLINLVFEGSGLLADADALIAGDFRRPRQEWLDDNYFHEPADETWVSGIEQAVGRREFGDLALRPQFRGTLGGRLRRVWDRKRALGPYDRSLAGHLALAVGIPLRGAVRLARRSAARRRAGRASTRMGG